MPKKFEACNLIKTELELFPWASTLCKTTVMHLLLKV